LGECDSTPRRRQGQIRTIARSPKRSPVERRGDGGCDQPSQRFGSRTVARLLAAPEPPKYERQPVGSKVDPFEDWIGEQLAADPRIQSNGCGRWLASSAIRAERFSASGFSGAPAELRNCQIEHRADHGGDFEARRG
jgi:hypothetical protein